MQRQINSRETWLTGALLVWCTVLLTYWRWRSPDPLALGMFWNLFLASLPLGFSALFQRAMHSPRPLVIGLTFGLWLLFFPNAPYVLTDLVHLRSKAGIPLWQLLATLLSCAATAVWLGYLSLAEVHEAVVRRWGQRVGWGTVGGSLLLAAFGVYLGRFLRWNSWDLFVHPLSLGKAILRLFTQPSSHPPPVLVTLVFGVTFFLGYLMFCSNRATHRP